MGLAGMLLDGFLGLGGGGEDGEVGIVDLWELTERQGIDAAAHFNGVPGTTELLDEPIFKTSEGGVVGGVFRA